MSETTNWNEYLSKRTSVAYTDREFVRGFLKGDLLEVGCGFGDFTEWCAEALGCRAIGIDPSTEAIARAQNRFPAATFFVGVAEDLPFPDSSFDSIVTLEVVEHLLEPSRFFLEALRVLRPGGYLVVQTPNYPVKRIYDFLYWLMKRSSSPKDDPTHFHPFSMRGLERLSVSCGFVTIAVVGRNILGELKLPFLSKIKRGSFARFFSQKTILVARKPLM